MTNPIKTADENPLVQKLMDEMDAETETEEVDEEEVDEEVEELNFDEFQAQLEDEVEEVEDENYEEDKNLEEFIPEPLHVEQVTEEPLIEAPVAGIHGIKMVKCC